MSRAQTRQQTEWFPCRFFSSESPAQPFALILLNQPLNWAAFESIAKSGMYMDMAPNSTDTEIRDAASITICADGGANRLHQQSFRNGFSSPYVGVFKKRSTTPSPQKTKKS
jgi:hypothetical protein